MAKAKHKNEQDVQETLNALAEEITREEMDADDADVTEDDAAEDDIDAEESASAVVDDNTKETAEADAIEDGFEEDVSEDAEDAEAEQAAAEGAEEEGEREIPAITQDDLRLVEAILFAAPTALTVSQIAERFPEDRVMLIPDVLDMLKEHYAARGVTLVQREKRWALRTATDLGHHLRLEKEQPKKFTRAAMETMAIVAYHQPVTRAEIENIRGVATSSGSLDALMEAGWIKPGKRREVPGRPVTWLTTQAFLDHFGLEKLEDLPGMDELKAAGLLDKRPAIEAMPTADLFDEDVNKPDIDPNEVTDEDLLGKPDANDEVLPEGEESSDNTENETVSDASDDTDEDDFDDEDGDDEDFDDEDSDDDADSDDDGDEDDSDADDDYDSDDSDDSDDEDASDDEDDEDGDDDGDDFDDEDDEDDDDDFDDEDDEERR